MFVGRGEGAFDGRRWMDEIARHEGGRIAENIIVVVALVAVAVVRFVVGEEQVVRAKLVEPHRVGGVAAVVVVEELRRVKVRARLQQAIHFPKGCLAQAGCAGREGDRFGTEWAFPCPSAPAPPAPRVISPLVTSRPVRPRASRRLHRQRAAQGRQGHARFLCGLGMGILVWRLGHEEDGQMAVRRAALGDRAHRIWSVQASPGAAGLVAGPRSLPKRLRFAAFLYASYFRYVITAQARSDGQATRDGAQQRVNAVCLWEATRCS